MSSFLRTFVAFALPLASVTGAEKSNAEAPNSSQEASKGPLAYDPKWNKYPEYLQRLIDVVQIQWEREMLGIATRPEAGTKVVLRFELTRNGRIQNLKVVKADSPDAATPCIAAITRRAPYSTWTPEMIASLGEKQEMTFSFEYL